MAGVKFSATQSAISTGTGAKTLVQVVAASNHRVVIKEVHVSFEGIVNTNKPILVELVRQTTAGTSSALTPRKVNEADDETLQVTARHTCTVEPTTGDILESMYIHPQTGNSWQATWGGELTVIGGNRLGLRVTAATSVNAAVTFAGEE